MFLSAQMRSYMDKPYLLFKNRKSPYWYAQIRLSDGSLSNNKSTSPKLKKSSWNGSWPVLFLNEFQEKKNLKSQLLLIPFLF